MSMAPINTMRGEVIPMNERDLATKEARVTYWENHGTVAETADREDLRIGDMYSWQKESADKYRLFGNGAATASA